MQTARATKSWVSVLAETQVHHIGLMLFPRYQLGQCSRQDIK